jgi:YVTN family beta-propeller protein
VTNFGGDGVSVIDPEGGRLVAQVRTGAKPHGAVIAPDGSAVYVSNEGDGTVSIIDPRRNQVTRTIEVGKEPNQLEVSADGRHLFVTLHGQDALAIVDVEQRKVTKVIPIGRTPHIALRSPDGSRIYATSEGDMKVVVVDARSWDVTGEVQLMAFPRVLAVSADGRRLYQTIRWLNGALVIDLEKKEVVDRVALGEPDFAVQGKDAHGLAITPDGRHLWLTTQTTHSATIIDTATLKVVDRIIVGKDPNWVGFTPDGHRAVISNTGSNDVSVIDVSSRKVVATVSVGLSPKRLAVGAVLNEAGQAHDEAHSPRLESFPVAEGPNIDGQADDPAWAGARSLETTASIVWPEPEDRIVPVVIKSVHTKTHIYFLLRWKDETKNDVSHKPWVWNAGKKTYEEGPEREDMAALAFEHTGVFSADMLSGDPAVWDVWHWKATRTNPQGHAMDKAHHYTLQKPAWKAKSYPARNGKTIWIARPEDEGETLEKKQPAPTAYQEDRVRQYLPGTPSGSAADVRAKGAWSDGWWTLELERRLDTGHPDDTAFDTSRTYRMAVSVHDHRGDMDKASGVIELVFSRPRMAWRFDEDTPGRLPEGWKIEGTNQRGPVATWVVKADADAPSKPNVLALTDTKEGAGGTFNLCWTDGVKFTDGVIEVKVKAGTGREDQGGGAIWRVKDKDNYYIARWNPLEDNFRLYYVKGGSRKMLETANVKADPAKWHTIRVEQKGDEIQCSLDGETLFKVQDRTFLEAGGVGLWTKADAATSFDDLVVERDGR